MPKSKKPTGYVIYRGPSLINGKPIVVIAITKSSKWVVNYVGTVRPTITYILVLELVAINVWIMWHRWANQCWLS